MYVPYGYLGFNMAYENWEAGGKLPRFIAVSSGFEAVAPLSPISSSTTGGRNIPASGVGRDIPIWAWPTPPSKLSTSAKPLNHPDESLSRESACSSSEPLQFDRKLQRKSGYSL
jgi:hypothetical protein